MRHSGPVRVLWVTAEAPDVSLGGGNIRQAHLLSAVARRHETHLLLAGRLRDRSLRDLLASVVETSPADGRAPRNVWARRLLDLRLAGPEGPPERYDGRAARKALQEHLADDGFDVVVVQHAGLTSVLPRRRQSCWVAELHNVESATLHALADVTSGRRQRWIRRAQAGRARRHERWLMASYDAVVAVSGEDAAALPGRAHVVPNGVDVHRWTPTELPDEARVVFTATLNYLPNVEGIDWFARDVWPRIRAVVPDARLDVVGRAPTASVFALADLPGVAVHPDVPDVRPFVQAARLCVVPLRVGSGSRLKVLEAWAAQRPVVGTAVGLAGLDVVDGENALVRDEPRDLAEGVASILRDPALARRLAAAGRARAVERYDWTRLGADYADWLATLR